MLYFINVSFSVCPCPKLFKHYLHQIKMLQISDKEFPSFIKKHKLAVIDLWAERCPACVMLSPVLEQLAKDKEFKGKIAFAKLDVDSNHEIASTFNIDKIPTILIFKNGKRVDKITGFQSKEVLKKRLEKFL